MVKTGYDRLRGVCRLLAVAALLWLGPAAARAELQHQVYFQDTPQELNVYKIHGRNDGPTMMIIGGIQGNEPGGFLSADLYADIALKRGHLIVVPRANFQSILQYDRGLNGDMNRKFGSEAAGDRDMEIVRILKDLIGQSDVLLNLHDGWGYYRPTYVSPMANPLRYGQSIIADCAEYVHSATGRKMPLQATAEKVLARLNEEIENPKYHFHFMNTRTGEKDSPYLEQRASATYYALTRCGIPAFGVETSKNLPTIEMKVHQHNLAVNAFMEVFGLETEQPRIYLVPPKLKYLVVSVNNQVPVAVADGDTLFVNPADAIEVIHVEANYERGLSVDIQGFGTVNDFRQPFKVEKPTFIVAQKDHIKFGRVQVALRPGGPEGPQSQPRTAGPFKVRFFIVEVEGRRHVIADGEQLDAVVGDAIRLVDVISEGPPPEKDFAVNFKGYVSNLSQNTGEDRGHLIRTAQDLLPRYSLSNSERVYAVVAEQGKRVLAKMTVRLHEPRMEYMILQRNGGPRLCVQDGESLDIKPGDQVQVLDLKTNILHNQGVRVDIKGRPVKNRNSDALLTVQAGRDKTLTLVVTREGVTLGQIVLKTG